MMPATRSIMTKIIRPTVIARIVDDKCAVGSEAVSPSVHPSTQDLYFFRPNAGIFTFFCSNSVYVVLPPKSWCREVPYPEMRRKLEIAVLRVDNRFRSIVVALLSRWTYQKSMSGWWVQVAKVSVVLQILWGCNFGAAAQLIGGGGD